MRDPKMYEFFKSVLIMLLVLLAIFWRRLCRLSVAVYYWANRGAIRMVVREGRLCRAWSVPAHELCVCDVADGNGGVLRTLARGNSKPDAASNASARKSVHGSVMSIEPTPKAGSDPTVGRARDFLMERCGGFRSAAATAAEVVMLM